MTSATQTSPLPSMRFQNDDERWQAVVDRDCSADGSFFYSVKTTGVYCRPSCAARLARRENVRFHTTKRLAELAGFRACKRCRPNEPSKNEQHRRAVSQACLLLENSADSPGLESLAEMVGMSPSHLHRVFKLLTGLTPKGYAMAHRSQRVRRELAAAKTVTDAVFNAGFNSNGRFYANSSRVLGMTPTMFRTGGAGTVIRFAVGECSLGSILVAASEIGLCTISIGDDPNVLIQELQDRFSKAELVGGDTNFESVVAQVVGFVDRPSVGLKLPLDVRGTAFQHRVWQLLGEIPCGQTATYTEIAQRLGEPNAVRAVAGACAANQLAVAIPCHRVIRIDGSLSGYRWGIERKAALLELEREATREVGATSFST